MKTSLKRFQSAGNAGTIRRCKMALAALILLTLFFQPDGVEARQGNVAKRVAWIDAQCYGTMHAASLAMLAACEQDEAVSGTFVGFAEFLAMGLETRNSTSTKTRSPSNNLQGGMATKLTQDGNVVVGEQDNGFFTPNHAFRWTVAGGPVDLGTLDPANNNNRGSIATDVSANGSIVVGYSDIAGGQQQHAFRWTSAGGMVDLGTPPAGANRASRATGISADGSVVVGDADFPDAIPLSGFRKGAFRWTSAGGFQALGSLESGFPSIATDVTPDGTVIIGEGGVSITVGGSSTNGSRAFRWTQAGGMTAIGPLAGQTFAAATAVSDNGNVIVGTSSIGPLQFFGVFGTGSAAFRWTQAGGIQDLRQLFVNAGVNMTGLTLISASAISSDGQFIAGSATYGGETVGYILQYCDAATSGTCTSIPDLPPFSIAASSASLRAVAGQSASLSLNLWPYNGFSSQVSFTCSGLPAGASCSFAPATVTPSGGPIATTVTVATNGGAVSSAAMGPINAVVLLATGLLFLGIAIVIPRDKTRGAGNISRASAALGLLVVALGVACSDSSNGTDPGPNGGTPAGTLPVTITATSGSGQSAVTSPVTISLTVTR